MQCIGRPCSTHSSDGAAKELRGVSLLLAALLTNRAEDGSLGYDDLLGRGPRSHGGNLRSVWALGAHREHLLAALNRQFGGQQRFSLHSYTW